MTTSTVLIIGASRGLGLALVAEHLRRGTYVVATVRGPTRTPLHDLAGEHLEIEHVDITDPGEVAALRQRLDGRSFDQLFVNAGVTNAEHETAADVTTEEFTRLMVTNALSPLRVVEALGDLVPADGTIAIMSSRQGSISLNESGGFEVYRASKSALNQLVRSYTARHRDDGRTLLLIHPGWVRTDLGGDRAALTVEESIPGIVSTIEAQRGVPGLQFLDHQGRTVAW